MKALWLTLALFGLTAASYAAPAFDPLPGGQRQAYRFDLSRMYPDEAAWGADVERARALAASVKSRKGRLLASPGDLLGAMEAHRDLRDVLVKLYAYGEFRAAVNTSDRAAYEAFLALQAEAGAQTSFLQVELKALTPEALEGMIAKEPRLAAFRYQIEDILRQGPHSLSDSEEALLSRLDPDLNSWQQVLFQKVFDRTAFAEISADGRTYNVHRDFETLIRHPDRDVRRRAYESYYAAFAEIRDLVGFALLREMKTLNAQAALRGFPTYYHQTLFDRYLTREQADNLYAQIEAQAGLYQAYQRLRMERVRPRIGGAEPEIWDMDLASGDGPEPRFTADEAVALISDALGVLGPEYLAELKALLDPKNGRMDIVGGPNRDQGAFCEGYHGFFLDNYQGLLTNVSTIAHEAGHGIHDQLVFNNKKSVLYGEGPGYMTESFAMFNEWLLRDRLLKSSGDEALRRYVREDALNEMMYLWEIARRAKFEMVAYDRVASGEITDEAGFGKACVDVGKAYDVWFQKYPWLEDHWIRKHHYWSVPTYYVNYVVAHVLALTYYQRYLEDPEGFSAKYTAMVRNGFDRPAAALLKDFLSIDLNDPKVLQGTFDLIGRTFRETGERPVKP
ncbi:MAG: M3 family oligoendopeptidase [Acidobacteriota bacterium]